MMAKRPKGTARWFLLAGAARMRRGHRGLDLRAEKMRVRFLKRVFDGRWHNRRLMRRRFKRIIKHNNDGWPAMQSGPRAFRQWMTAAGGGGCAMRLENADSSRMTDG
jgi:hypothetical protein